MMNAVRASVPDPTWAEAPTDPTPAALRRRYSTAHRPVAWIYWVDMLTSALLGWSGLAASVYLPRFSAPWFLATAVATLAMYRAVLFIHELAHLRRNAIPRFELAWDLLVGIPMLVPSLMYVGSHGEHHRRVVFGTDKDPEYAPIGQWSAPRIVASVLPLIFVPVLLPLRWGIFGPLSYLFPPLRELVVGYFSTLVINPTYKRRLPEGRSASRWRLEEAGTALVCWSVGLGIWGGWLSASWAIQWYVVASAILALNHVRTLVAHRYDNDGEPLDLMGQYLDSVNLSGGSWFTCLLAPVGLRFHALHHLLPTVPYHALGAIHREMLRELPDSTAYRAADHHRLIDAIRRLFEQHGGAHLRP